jgi:excisionase family DNA binding protein
MASRKAELLQKSVTEGQDDPWLQLVADGFARVEEGADFLGISRAAFYKLLDRELPSAKIGKSRRVPWKALRDYAARCLSGQPA